MGIIHAENYRKAVQAESKVTTHTYCLMLKTANQPSDFTLTEPLREKCCISIFSAKHPNLEVTCLNASHFQVGKVKPRPPDTQMMSSL